MKLFFENYGALWLMLSGVIFIFTIVMYYDKYFWKELLSELIEFLGGIIDYILLLPWHTKEKGRSWRSRKSSKTRK